MKKVYILSHTDIDGYFSAALVQLYFNLFLANGEEIEYKHKSWTYGRQLPNLKFIKENYDYFFVVDFCLDFYFMKDLYEHFGDKFVWIDHHVKPDNEFLEQFKVIHPGEQINGLIAEKEHSMCAAYLVYYYFEKNYNAKDSLHEENHPEWLKLISDFDCWNKYDDTIWNSRIMPIYSALKGIITNPSLAYSYIQKRYDSGHYYDTLHSNRKEFYNYQTDSEIKEGQILYKGILSIYKAEAIHGFERILPIEMNGEYRTIRAWICNTQNRSSVIFEQMENIDDYDVFIPYHFNGEKYFYSMYTFKKDIKCNQISILNASDNHVLLTFNGHDDAAGANSENFAFPKS